MGITVLKKNVIAQIIFVRVFNHLFFLFVRCWLNGWMMTILMLQDFLATNLFLYEQTTLRFIDITKKYKVMSLGDYNQATKKKQNNGRSEWGIIPRRNSTLLNNSGRSDWDIDTSTTLSMRQLVSVRIDSAWQVQQNRSLYTAPADHPHSCSRREPACVTLHR